MVLLELARKKINNFAIDHLDAIQKEFKVNGYVVIKAFYNSEMLDELVKIWKNLEPFACHKNVEIEYMFKSQRVMQTISGRQIDKATTTIKEFYCSTELMSLLSYITQDKVFALKDSIERYVINCLSNVGDVHGLHIDSFPYACSHVVYAPEIDCGGVLEIYDGFSGIFTGKINKVALEVGDIVIFKSSELPHLVSPLIQETKRIVINMAYANIKTFELPSYSRELLYS